MGALKRSRLLALTAALLPLAATADDSPYCRTVRARAASEAALLMSPQLVVQGLRLPRSFAGIPLSELDSGGLTAYQARAGVAFSPVELVKGLELTQASEGDCEKYLAQSALEEFIDHAEGAARLPALRNQATYLEAHAQTWKTALGKEEERFASRVITLFELNQVRARATTLERRLVQASGEAERIAARGYLRPPGTIAALLETWLERSLTFERQASQVRALSFWNVRLTAGVVASDRPLDWYGLAEVSVHLGALTQWHQERVYLAARTDELRHDRNSVEYRLRELQRTLALLRDQARRELEFVEGQLGSIASTRQTLERAESPNATYAVSLLTFDLLVAESEKTYLATLIDELSSLLVEHADG